MLQITKNFTIDEQFLHEDFIRASGPGGQHVNKVSTAVQLRFDARRAGLPEEMWPRLVRLAGNRMTADGVIILDARRFRTQEQNRQDARQRLITLLRKAARRPKPRRPTTPSKAAKQRRLAAKRHRSRIKRQRRFDADRDL